MKKFISILFITVMVLSLAACSSKDEIPASEEIEDGTTKLSDNVNPIQNDDDNI